MTTESPAAGGLADGATTAPAALTTEQRVEAVVGGAAEPFVVPADMLDWGKTKGYNAEKMQKVFAENPDIYAMANSYRQTEKMVGTERLAIPKDVADTDGWNQLYNKMGRPETADGYKIDLPETATPEFGTWAKTTMHQLGLNQTQATGFTKAFSDRLAATKAAEVANMKAAAVKDQATLEKEWGADFKGNVEIAGRARAALAKEVGIDGAELDKMESVFGLAKSLKIMNAMGRSLKLDSDTFEGAGTGERQLGTTQSVETAKSQKEALFADPAFVKKFQSNDVEAKAKVARLNAIIAPTYNA